MKKKIALILIFLGLIVILYALYTVYEGKKEESTANEAVLIYEEKLSEELFKIEEERKADDKSIYTLYEKYPEIEMPTITIDGIRFCGMLKISKIDLSLPIVFDYSDENLDKGPCLYDGSIYTGNAIIAGHNFGGHFGRLPELTLNDTVVFEDSDGNIFTYKVVSIETVNGSDVDIMKDDYGWDLTLFTCTFSGNERHTVRLRKA